MSSTAFKTLASVSWGHSDLFAAFIFGPQLKFTPNMKVLWSCTVKSLMQQKVWEKKIPFFPPESRVHPENETRPWLTRTRYRLKDRLTLCSPNRPPTCTTGTWRNGVMSHSETLQFISKTSGWWLMGEECPPRPGQLLPTRLRHTHLWWGDNQPVIYSLSMRDESPTRAKHIGWNLRTRQIFWVNYI